jgi:DNA-binding CsgD family transcriptional regulator
VTRRPVFTRNPIEHRVANSFFEADYERRLAAALAAMTIRDAAMIKMRYGLDDGVPRTLDEIGRVYGVNRERIRTLLQRAEAKLRDDENFQALIPYMDTDHGLPRDPLRRWGAGVTPGPVPELIKCEIHGSYRAPEIDPHQCAVCPCSVWGRGGGRHKLYCSDACRQAAYRQRRAAKSSRAGP